MSPKFLVQSDALSHGSNAAANVDFQSIRYLDSVLITADSTDLGSAQDFLQNHFGESNIAVDARALKDPAQIVSLLNNGAAKAFISGDTFERLLSNGSIEDLSRLVVGAPAESLDSIHKLLSEAPGVGGIVIEGSVPTDVSEKLHSSSIRIFAPLTKWNEATFDDWTSKGIIPIVPASELTADPAKDPAKVPLHTLLLHGLESDRADGLWPTVVLSELGTCLGLVYSSAASVAEALRSGRGVYQSRKRKGLWIKGETSGDVQELVRIAVDCDGDTLVFTVRQKGEGFCHLKTDTCFGPYSGLAKLQQTLKDRAVNAPPGSYTAKMFSNPKLLQAKIMEEADELCRAESRSEIAAEAADLIYFALTKCVASGIGLEDVEQNLDLKSLRVSRRKGDAKPEWAQKVGLSSVDGQDTKENGGSTEKVKEAAGVAKSKTDDAGIQEGQIRMRSYSAADTEPSVLDDLLQRPAQKSSEKIVGIVRGILDGVRDRGDAAMLEYMRAHDQVVSVTTPVLRAPFPEHLMQVDKATREAIDVAFANIYKFHKSQEDKIGLEVETMEGVVCSRFSRPIERVGLYVPGGTAVLPSTALMLGVPAMIAGCKTIIIACRPRADGTPTPEVVYIAHKVHAECIVLAGGAQAIAGMAYGTESIPKVQKILGPGNQFVTLAKMLVSNDAAAGVAIDMPAGPSEVLVMADKSADPAFVAADLLSQAEHGPDSQVVLIAVALEPSQLSAIEKELHKQANALPRVGIVKGAIDHSITLIVQTVEEAMEWSNKYAPEHLILQIEQPEEAVKLVANAGSVFIGEWTPESVGDYAAGVNHSLPTSGYARQYSGVNLASFTKNITSTKLSETGLKNLSSAVTQLARVEGLDAHRRAVEIRMEKLSRA